jgi:hypothetical protein
MNANRNTNINTTDVLYYIGTGAVAGSVGTVISHPFDTIKTHLQAGNSLGIMNRSLYQNIKWSYSGVGPSIMGYMIEKTFIFGFYLFFHDLFDLDDENLFHRTANGFFTGLIASPSITVFDQLKIDRQNKNKTQYNIQHLFKGLKLTAKRESLGFAVYFNIYHIMSKKYNNNDKESFAYKTIKTAGIGALSGGISWIAIYTFDTNKTRVQSGKTGGLINEVNKTRIQSIETGGLINEVNKTRIQSIETGGLINEFRNVLSGVKSKLSVTYRGFHIAMLRVIPFHATCFVVWDLSKQYKNTILNYINNL